MASSIGSPPRKGSSRMPIELSFVLGTVGVGISIWLASIALTGDAVPIVGSPRGALIAIVVIGMASCGVAGIGQAPIIGWTHPITILGIVVGVIALVVAGAGLLGWDALVSPASGIVPVGTNVAVTTERIAIGLLAVLIAVKWAIGVPLALLVRGT